MFQLLPRKTRLKMHTAHSFPIKISGPPLNRKGPGLYSLPPPQPPPSPPPPLISEPFPIAGDFNWPPLFVVSVKVWLKVAARIQSEDLEGKSLHGKLRMAATY